MRALSAALAILMIASPALARPKGSAAQAEFERGVAAFQQKEFAQARDAFMKSLALEDDVETKYALVQTERLLGNCDASIKLSQDLLETETKAANIEALKKTIAECQSMAAPKEPATKPPAPVKDPSAPSSPAASASGTADDGQVAVETSVVTSQRSPWWKDPYGDALLGAGIVGIGVGAGFLWFSKKAADDQDTQQGVSDAKFHELGDRAKSRGRIGMIAGIAGVALVGGGIYRYMTRGGGERDERTTMTGWATPDGGGIAAIGRF